MADRQVEGGVRLVGGAAMSLKYNYDRLTTEDLDVVHPDRALQDLARELAAEQGWDTDWLNGAASVYFPPMYDQDWVEIGRYGTLTVLVSSAQQLLAMKLFAGRGERDDEDIEVLCRHLSIESSEEAVQVFERYYPREVLKDRAKLTLEGLFAE